jgi:hypothetical protein
MIIVCGVSSFCFNWIFFYLCKDEGRITNYEGNCACALMMVLA